MYWPRVQPGDDTTGQIDTCIAGLMYKCWDIVLVFLFRLSILLNDNKTVKDIV